MFSARVLGAREPPVLGASGFVFINMTLRQHTVERIDGQDGSEHLGNKLTYGVGHANDTSERPGVWLLHRSITYMARWNGGTKRMSHTC